MDLEKMIKAHSDYSQLYHGHNKGCKICFILAEVERLKAEDDVNTSCIVESNTIINKLREALEYYADPYNHPWSNNVAKEALKDSP